MGFLSWGYQRSVHLLSLLAIVVLYVVYWTMSNGFILQLPEFTHDSMNNLVLNGYWYPSLATLLIITWIVRGCAPCFPYYHYSTLLLELLLQIVSFAAHEICFLIASGKLLNQTKIESYEYIIYHMDF